MLILIGNRVFHQPLHVIDGWKDIIESGPSWSKRMAAAQRGIKETLRPYTLAHRIPKLFSAIRLQPGNPGLPARTPLQHALQSFKAMEVVTVHASIADRDGLFYPGVVWHLQRRDAPCDGKTGTSEERESH